MAFWRVCLRSALLLSLALLLTPASAAADQPSVGITAPSTASRHSSYTVTVTSTASALTTATFALTASFADVTFSEAAWTIDCPVSTSCTSVRTVTVFTAGTGGSNLRITVTGRSGALTASAFANTWVRGSATLVPAAPTMQTLQTQNISIALQTVAPLGTTFQLSLSGAAAAGSSAPATVTVASGGTTGTFQLAAGPTPGNLTISATTGSAFYAAPAPVTITVLSPTEVATPAGSSVTVTPPVPPGGAVPVRVTFTTVTASGYTKLTNVAATAAPPSGYESPGTPLYFGVSTTAGTSGLAIVCATYPDGAAADETGLRLFALTPAGWIDTTVSVDAAANAICGSTIDLTSATFAIFRLNSAPEAGIVSGPASTVIAGAAQQFSATITDADAADTHTGTWMWGDGTTSPATITTVDGVTTATGEHAFEAGTYQVRLVVSDGAQRAASPDLEIVADGAAPVIASISASPETLWPANSKMHTVALTVSSSDDSGPPVCAITGVTASAPNVSQTAFNVTAALTVQLKAFAHSSYAIVVTCTDAVGRTAGRTVTVDARK